MKKLLFLICLANFATSAMAKNYMYLVQEGEQSIDDAFALVISHDFDLNKSRLFVGSKNEALKTG